MQTLEAELGSLPGPGATKLRESARAAAAAHDSTDDAAPLKASFGMGDAGVIVLSLLLHVVVLLPLAAFHLASQSDDLSTIFSAFEVVPEEEIFDVAVADNVGDVLNADSVSAASAATAVTLAQQPTVREETFTPEEANSEPELAAMDETAAPNQDDLTQEIKVEGGATENTVGGTEGAIDRIALEIRESLRTRKTTVVWLFDASLSLKERHEMIANRFENVYKQLQALEPTAEKSLKTAVWTYGEKFKAITEEPVDDVRPLVEKIRKIEPDNSGKENVFTALNTISKKMANHARQTQRRVLIVIVTDEKGDDPQYLDEVVTTCRRVGTKVYVVGNAALFGREKGYVAWKMSDGEVVYRPVDQGPETVEPEGLQLGFWGGQGFDLELMSAGFGPYALTRLCKETNGLYFVAEESKDRFDPAVMRGYQPDYRPIREYMKQLERNIAKASLVRAAKATKLDDVPLPSLVFRADSDSILREQLTEAQKPLAVMDYKLTEMELVLKAGEKDRAKIAEPRWRAAYDLAYGRVLAMRARAAGYNQMLAEMRSTVRPFKKDGSNEWRLAPSANNQAAANIKKIEKQALTYLKRVVDEHAGTPWARIAEVEMSQPLGWEWQESKGNYRPLNMMQAGEQGAVFAEEEMPEMADKPKPKPREPLPNL